MTKTDTTTSERIEVITFICGHSGKVVRRCAAAYSRRFCDDCALTQLPKPSECLRQFLKEHGNCDHFGPMLGPIGAVVYARQSYFGIDARVAWSGSEAMHDAIEAMEPSRMVTPYIDRFAEAGL